MIGSPREAPANRSEAVGQIVYADSIKACGLAHRVPRSFEVCAGLALLFPREHEGIAINAGQGGEDLRGRGRE